MTVRPLPRWVWIGSAYVLACSLLMLLGHLFFRKTVEMVGFLLLAGTVLPLPFDVYLFHVVPLYPVLTLAVVAALLNTVAVLVERVVVLDLLAKGRGRRVLEVTRTAQISAWFGKAPFAIIAIAASTVLPFEPARFLAVANGYSPWRYGLATFLGRGVRFYLLVSIGDYLIGLHWLSWALWGLVILYVLSLVHLRHFGGIFARAEANRAEATAGERVEADAEAQ